MITRSLPVKLTPTEVEVKGRQISGLVRRLDQLRDEKRAFLSKMRSQFKETEEAIGIAATAIETGTEDREVAVTETADFKNGVVVIHRVDTGELVTTRILEQAERQGHLLEIVPDGITAED